ncbi:hypothetical protein HYFRA_00006439 [Hymenoscyphus fraxineus]|uniref:AB hydrolase-1 domain-containing protein n=1 Tax=Hymenoscyphus fraxineus TaxID=746836 RepID=A0A9N9KPM6_9HELO|nr:hypothetical protein HYFRA_00006439 [Hymenoscyphus fraxineus]
MKNPSQSLFLLALLNFLVGATAIVSNDTGGLDFTYPYPVQFFNVASQQNPSSQLSMAYMDIAPANAQPKETIVLLHGKNFCGATWNHTIEVLLTSGYRVIAPDQIGFCKSSKPTTYQFSLSQLALNTNNLLHSLGIFNASIIGHSMGGMLSARYALMFPSQTNRLVMVNPLGLENWFALGVPYQAVDITYQTELSTSFSSIKSYQQATYYAGTWDSSYDIWVNMLLSVYKGSQGTEFAYDQALVTDMLFTQPVIAELSNLKMRSLLVIGDKDNTAIGKAWAPADVKPLLGHYEVLGKQVSAKIPNCTLVEFVDLGHAPQIQDPNTFHEAILGWLSK